MRSHKLFIHAALLLLCLFTAGCRREDLTSPIIDKASPVLLRIEKDGNNYLEYSYENGFVSKCENYISGLLRSSIRLEYNEIGLTEKETVENSADKYRLVYQYNTADLITKIDIQGKFDSSYQSVGYLLPTYNTLGRLVKTEQYLLTDNNPWNHIDTDYDIRGNLIEKRLYYGGALQESTSYLYDDKINPLSVYKNSDLFTRTFSANNIVRITVILHYDENKTIIKNYNYSYSQDGYPVSRRIETIENGFSNTVSETYRYK